MSYRYGYGYGGGRSLLGVQPPAKNDLIQWIDGRYRPIVAGDPVPLDPNRFIALDKSPTGAYALRTAGREVVAVSIADRPALTFDNNDITGKIDYIDATAQFDINQDFEMCLDFSFDGSTPNFQAVFSSEDGTNRSLYIERDGTTNTAGFKFYTLGGGATPAFTLSADIFIQGENNHIKMVRVGNLISLYKNNTLVDSVTDEQSLQPMTSSRWGSQETARTAGGVYSNICIYQRGTAVYEWSCDEGSGNIIHDTSGQGNHGTLIDGSPFSAWSQGLAYKYDINASNLISTVDYPTYPNQGELLTQSELDTRHAPRLFYTALTGYRLARYLVYSLTSDLTTAESLQANKYVGR